MITAGVDVGIEAVKVVVLKDGRVLASSVTRSGGFDRTKAVEQAWSEALASARLTPSDVSKVVATGQGKWDVRFANDNIVELMADTKVASFLYPSAKSVVDVGADQARAATFDARGNILNNVLNQKCAAGIGTFLRTTARTLEMTLDEMSRLTNGSHHNVSVNDACCVFAEIDTHWLIHNNTPKSDIVQAINEAIAARINSMLNEKIALQKDIVLIGGVARNTGLVNALKKRAGINFLIPEQPQFAGALGAALIAAG